MSEIITYACMTQNRVENLKRNLPRVLPYVDKAVIVDGGSSDGTEEYLESLGPKVQRVFRAWDDSFANQWNEYLKHINEGWVLLFDDDEHASIELCETLRSVVDNSNNGQDYSVVEYRCNPQDLEAGWDPGPATYWRQVLFRWTPNLHYMVDLHQSIRGYQNSRLRRRDEVYYHIKTRKQEFQNACRNYFIGGCWPPGAHTDGVKAIDWHELKAVLRKNYPDVEIFSDLNNILVQGDVHPALREWILKYANKEGQLYNELRAYNTYYYELLHPEEAA